MLKDDRARIEELKGSEKLAKISGEKLFHKPETPLVHTDPLTLPFYKFSRSTNVDLHTFDTYSTSTHELKQRNKFLLSNCVFSTCFKRVLY